MTVLKLATCLSKITAAVSLFLISSCATYQREGQTYDLPINAYKYVTLNPVPDYVFSVISSRLRELGLQQLELDEVRSASTEVKAQTLVGMWEYLSHVVRDSGSSAMVSFILLDPLGRGVVYKGKGEYRGLWGWEDDLTGATSAALADLSVYTGFDQVAFASSASSQTNDSYWDRKNFSDFKRLPSFVVSEATGKTLRANRKSSSKANSESNESRDMLLGTALATAIGAAIGGTRGAAAAMKGAGESYLGKSTSSRSIYSSVGSSIDYKHSYEIDHAINDETFIINDEVYEAKTYCLNWEEGDKVVFLDGSPYGSCASAKLYNEDRKEICEVWCQ